MQKRIGSPQQVHSGTMFYPLDPRPDEISIVDIAHGLANICRFNGHTREFYSVAQHSVFCSQKIAPEFALYALLHDASEAYLCDIPKPLKELPEMEFYRTAEAVLEVAIFETFGLLELMRCGAKLATKEVDTRALHTEKRDILKADIDWECPLNPYPERIVSLYSPGMAKRQFLDRFLHLTQGSISEHVQQQRSLALLEIHYG